MVRKMSPLVFTASYKVLDMVFEWTISQNGTACPFRFEDKIEIINRVTTLIYPDFLQSDTALRAVAIALYRQLTPYRNAITHNRWGKVTDGSLDFDFHRKGNHYTKSVPFDDVLALADSAELLGTMLVNHVNDQNRTDTLRWLWDKWATFHGKPLFNIKQPRYLQVIRRTVLPASGPIVVDLQQIKAMVQQQATGHPVTYDLTVIADAAPRPVIWTIPFAQIPDRASLSLEGQWDQFKTTAGKDLESLEAMLGQQKAVN